MTYRKTVNAHSKKVGRPSKKRTGYISTSVRLSVEDNRDLRKAAGLVKVSFNGWAVETLRRAAKNIIRKHEQEKGSE
jgi:predicted HicB family RNase H-like nuclease